MGVASGTVSFTGVAIESSVLYSPGQYARFDNPNRGIYTAALMGKTGVEREKNTGSGFAYTFTGKGFQAHADYDPVTGEAKVTFERAAKMGVALEEVINKLQSEARKLSTNPALPIRIDIHAGQFDKQLARLADRFDLKGPIPADESGAEGLLYRAEIPLTR